MSVSEKVREIAGRLEPTKAAQLGLLANEVAELEKRALPRSYGYGCVSDGGSEIDVDGGKFRSNYMDGGKFRSNYMDGGKFRSNYMDAGKFRSNYMDAGRLFVSDWRDSAEEALQESIALAGEPAEETTA